MKIKNIIGNPVYLLLKLGYEEWIRGYSRLIENTINGAIRFHAFTHYGEIELHLDLPYRLCGLKQHRTITGNFGILREEAKKIKKLNKEF